MQFLFDKSFLKFTAKFLLIFAILYFGTLAWIGFAAPGGFYSPFIEKYLDYVSWIKISLIKGVQALFSLFGIPTFSAPGFIVQQVNGRGVYIAMDCVGYGVYSFWIAYIVANKGRFLFKTIWMLGGVFLLWLINVIRIGLYLRALNENWNMPLGIDHHTWFNIFAYLAIFIMIWRFEKKQSSTTKTIHEQS